jgi:hypothetical protein
VPILSAKLPRERTIRWDDPEGLSRATACGPSGDSVAEGNEDDQLQRVSIRERYPRIGQSSTRG